MDHAPCGGSLNQMSFVSMGMLIIDDVYYDDSRAPMMNVLGGAGTYATMGARLFHDARIADSSSAELVGFVIHAGSDFPEEVRTEIEAWDSGTVIIDTPGRLTTRGKNVYRKGIRDFEFSNPKVQVEPRMLNDKTKFSKTYHLICEPVRCIQLVKGIIAERKAAMEERALFFSKPIFVWEPMEGSCRPEELQLFYEALKYVDVFSPNEHELGLLFNGFDHAENTSQPRDLLFRRCHQLLALGSESKLSAIIIRMGAAGCVVATVDRFVELPAYHTPPLNATPEELATWQDKKAKAFDVTGGGNAFVGGFCVGLVSQMNGQIEKAGLTDFEIAAVHGNVAASFAIEQVGMPKSTRSRKDGKELWNGERVEERLQNMLKICAVAACPYQVKQEKRNEGNPRSK